jgi:hypothetical protein
LKRGAAPLLVATDDGMIRIAASRRDAEVR